MPRIGFRLTHRFYINYRQLAFRTVVPGVLERGWPGLGRCSARRQAPQQAAFEFMDREGCALRPPVHGTFAIEQAALQLLAAACRIGDRFRLCTVARTITIPRVAVVLSRLGLLGLFSN
jgi:hypothetical protein